MSPEAMRLGNDNQFVIGQLGHMAQGLDAPRSLSSQPQEITAPERHLRLVGRMPDRVIPPIGAVSVDPRGPDNPARTAAILALVGYREV